MSPAFRIGEAHLHPAEPAGSTRTTEAADSGGGGGETESDSDAYFIFQNQGGLVGFTVNNIKKKKKKKQVLVFYESRNRQPTVKDVGDNKVTVTLILFLTKSRWRNNVAY